MYRHFTVHVDTEDPDFDAKLQRVLGLAEELHAHATSIELHETVPTAENGDVFIAGWEGRD